MLDAAQPAVTWTDGTGSHRATARLVVGADGRNSQVRRALGFELAKDPPHHLFSGLLVDGADELPGGAPGDRHRGRRALPRVPPGRRAGPAVPRLRVGPAAALHRARRSTGVPRCVPVRLHAGVGRPGRGDADQPVRDVLQRGHVGRRARARRCRPRRRRGRMERPDHRAGPVDRDARRQGRERDPAGIRRLVGRGVRAVRRGAPGADAPPALRRQPAGRDLQRVRSGGRGATAAGVVTVRGRARAVAARRRQPDRPRAGAGRGRSPPTPAAASWPTDRGPTDQPGVERVDRAAGGDDGVDALPGSGRERRRARPPAAR